MPNHTPITTQDGGGAHARPSPIRPLAAVTASAAGPLLRALRPLQWTKNAVVFAALVFAGRFFEPPALAQAAAAFAAFCAVSSAGYLVNDLRDAEADRLHPEKRHRPIAAGELSPSSAAIAAAALVALGLVAAWLVRPGLAAVVAAYAALSLAYSFALKRVAVLDVLAIGAGFVLRAVGGGVAIAAPISGWLYACTLLLALLVGFGKRRHELAALGAAAARHRPALRAYRLPWLDALIAGLALGTVLAYALYALATAPRPGHATMLLTVPFVAAAVGRYLYLLRRRGLGGSPELLLFADLPFLLCVAAWGVACLLILSLAGV